MGGLNVKKRTKEWLIESLKNVICCGIVAWIIYALVSCSALLDYQPADNEVLVEIGAGGHCYTGYITDEQYEAAVAGNLKEIIYVKHPYDGTKGIMIDMSQMTSITRMRMGILEVEQESNYDK